MNSANETKPVASTDVEPEYEWGVKYHAPGGVFHTDWGYSEDPRTTGVIDEDGEIEVGMDYRAVIAVGKRVKTPEIWENLNPWD